MATAIHRAAETWRYILQSDRALEPSQQSVFVLRPLTLAERQRVRDALTRTHVDAEGRHLIASRLNEVRIELALTNVVSVENFPAGEPKPWPAGAPLAERAAYLEILGDEHVREIGNEIFEHSVIETAPQTKVGDDWSKGSPAGNSSPPGLTSSSGGSSAETASTTAPPATGTPG
jgi:hypothetical protein